MGRTDPQTIPGRLLAAAAELRRSLDALPTPAPAVWAYDPLAYAWPAYRRYVERFATGPRRVVFLGMNPGPWGMAQTGVPFGDAGMVRSWLEIEADIGRPEREHPRRPVAGFAVRRGEVSGQRLWGLFRDRFGTAGAFFRDHFVANYCPLLLLDERGGNLTPDKLRPGPAAALFLDCDRHLRALVETLSAEWLVGVGRFAEASARRALAGVPVKIGHILHPSPASPAANRDWAGSVVRQLQELGVW